MSTKIIQAPDLDHDAMMLAEFGHKVSPNGRLERRIVANLIAHLEAHGFTPESLFDGEEEPKVSDAKSAMELIFNLDECTLWVRKGERRHGIFLTLGEGLDIICDYNHTEGDPDGFAAAMDAFDVEEFA
jgi:hypothetical protein